MTVNRNRQLAQVLPWTICMAWLFLLWWLGGNNTGQELVYPLDDTYIHLSLAKNLHQSGNWGISPHAHQFSSSSPWFTLLLTGAMKLFGDQVSLPLWLNLLLLPGMLFWLARVMPESRTNSALIAMIVLVPLPTLALFGMEHLWHVGVVLWLLREWRNHQGSSDSFPWRLVLLCALATGFRYESMFLIGSISLVFGLQRDGKSALGCLIAGAIPIVGFGLWSVFQGGTFLPLSILGKGHSPITGVGGWLGWLMAAAQRLYEHPFLVVLLLSLGVPFWQKGLDLRRKQGGLALVASLTILVHIGFAEVGGLRYEAYLIAMGVFVWFSEDRKTYVPETPFSSYWVRWLIWGLLLFPFGLRTAYFSWNYPLAVQNIYHQQIQSARFLQIYFPDAKVAANDIGAISYYTDIHLMDMLGIGDPEVYALQKTGKYQAGELQALASKRNIQLAVVHPDWLAPVLPPDWQALQSWVIPDNFICADARIQWLVVDPGQLDTLTRALAQFTQQLPPEVLVEWEGKP